MTSDGYSVGKKTTEWHDALVKHKIREKTKKEPTNDAIDTKRMWEEKEKDPYADKTLEDLNELEDEIPEDTLEAYKKKRLAELQAKAKADKFGRVKPISKPEYVKEVTEASKEQAVICCLFVFGQEESQILLQILEKLAAKFKTVKIVKIQGQDAIPNYKDSFCPTLVIYKDGDPIGNIKGLYNFGGKKVINADIVEWEIAQTTSIWKTTLEENPRKFKLKKIGGTNNNANKKYTIVKKDNYDSDSDSLDID